MGAAGSGSAEWLRGLGTGWCMGFRDGGWGWPRVRSGLKPCTRLPGAEFWLCAVAFGKLLVLSVPLW